MDFRENIFSLTFYTLLSGKVSFTNNIFNKLQLLDIS